MSFLSLPFRQLFVSIGYWYEENVAWFLGWIQSIQVYKSFTLFFHNQNTYFIFDYLIQQLNPPPQ